MRKYSALLFMLGLFLISCGGDGESNTEPSVPSLTYPTNNLLCIDNVLEFRWSASSDAEGDEISYRIEIARDEQFDQIVHADGLNGTSRIFDLEKGQTFYWRVKAADDNQNQSEFSTAWRFYTQGDPIENLLPEVPELLNPSLGTTLDTSEVSLEWESADSDFGDVLVYDLYFGTDENPPMIETNLDAASFTVSLSPATTYYWKVVAKDSNGGATIGPVWTFSTN